MNKLDISVVMSVFNSASTLPATLDSVLTQEGINLELIAIDDGSTDDTCQILLDYAARDPRLIALHQENRGLTAALIRGCALAQGEFVARQDAGGDISLPSRFAHQLMFFDSHATSVMTACGTLFVDPEGQPLYEVRQYGHELHDRLRATSLDRIAGPSRHGAVMFRKSAYERVGGYRGAFRVAQDLDLWCRMAEIGTCLATPDVFYVTRISAGSITYFNLQQQVRATQAILRCAEARREGRDEAKILEDVETIAAPSQGWLSERMRKSAHFYFLGSVLRTTKPRRAYSYFCQALAWWPLHARAWLGLLRSLVRMRGGCVRSDATIAPQERG
jgi:glycosyltransferase involved in cell wall biosynthesis